MKNYLSRLIIYAYGYFGLQFNLFWYNAAFISSDCSDKLPAKMGTNKYCKKLKQTCSKLETMCSEKLMDAIGDGNDAKKCAKALKEDAKQRVETFCPVTCMKCGKFNISLYFIVRRLL